jgi:hypothetical protein
MDILLHLVGQIGSTRGIKATMETRRKAFETPLTQSHYQSRSRPFNGAPLFDMPRSQIGTFKRRRVHLVASESVGKILSINTRLSSTILRTFIDDRACLAFIMQQSLDALASGKARLSCLFASYLDCQQIEIDQITRAAMCRNAIVHA